MTWWSPRPGSWTHQPPISDTLAAEESWRLAWGQRLTCNAGWQAEADPGGVKDRALGAYGYRHHTCEPCAKGKLAERERDALGKETNG